MLDEVEWARMTRVELCEFAAKPRALAILPVGALEQHGPHLPTITDTASAHAAAVRAARLVSAETPVAVLPGFWLGLSEHHFPFGATVSIDSQAYWAVLDGIARSLKVLGVSRLLIVNGHGGNVEPLAVIVRELAVKHAMAIVSTTPWYLSPTETHAVFDSNPQGRHACEGETSIMLAIAPDTVRTERFASAVQYRPQGVSCRPGFYRFYSFAEIAPLAGCTGDPRSATAEKGERFLNIQAKALAEGILDESLWTPPQPVWSPAQ